jgi:iron complex outermembrane recepter protein
MRLCAYTAAIAAGGLLLLASSANAQAPEPPTPAPPAASSTQLPPVVVDAPAQKKAAPKKKTAKAKQNAPAAASSPQPQAPATASGSQGDSAFKSPANSFVAKTSAAATKTDTPILETPQSISVVTREQLDTRDAKTMVEALQYVPGIYTHPGGKDPRFDQYQIRGFDAQGNAAFRDGLKELGSAANFNHFRTEPYGLERIDVIRGPASVLYGQIAPGGLVNAITKRPTSETIREVQGKIGTNDLFEGAFDLSGASDPSAEFMFRLTGLVRNSDAQIAHFADFVPDDRLFIAPSFTWRPDDDTTFTVLTDFQRDESGNAFPIPIATLSPTFQILDVNALPLFMGDPSFNKFEQDQFRLGYQFEHRFNDVFTVRQGLRYGEIDLDYRYLTVANVLFQGGSPTQNRVARTIDEQTRTFTVDNQLQTKVSTGAVKHTILTGLDYQHFGLDTVTYGGPAPSLNIRNPIYWQNVPTPTTRVASTDQKASQIGVYAQEQAKLDDWVLTFGGRYDWANMDSLNRINNRLSKADDEAFTGRAGLAYVFDMGLAPYISYSESFLPTTGTDFFGNPFAPTTGQQYETGLKFEPLGSRSRLTLALFDITQQNVLTPDPTPGRIGFNVQTGEIRSRGFEAEAVTNVVEGFNLIATYTKLDVEVTKSTTTATIGKAPIVTPEELASIFADYTFQTGPLAGFGFGAGARYVGKSYMDNVNLISNDAYTVADAALHYTYDDVTLALNVSNLFNREETTCTTAGGCQYISPQIVTSSVRYRW